ncbi:MAG: hypothetical protein LAP21_08460 [Acidobacteriia bacterium]|nr:hypothetical protein [Terriglobia bacterium]
MLASIELYLPNRKTLQDLYVAPESELPKGDPRCQVFNFAPVNPLETQEQAWSFDRSMLVWGLTGSMNDNAAPGAAVAAGFRFQILQSHNGVRRMWFNKHQIQQNVLGSGATPFLLRRTHPIALGDTLTVEVKSLVTAAQANVTRMQVCLFGVIVPDDSPLLRQEGT